MPLGSAALLAVATLLAAATGVAVEPTRAPCIRSWAVPIYQGVGWSHFVDVANDCEVAIDCDVATTIDPAPTYPVHVLPGEVVRVRTRYGSFTPQFEPIVECQPETADTPTVSQRMRSPSADAMSSTASPAVRFS